MKGSEVLEKVLHGNRRFMQGERTGVCNPADVDLGAMAGSQSPIAAVYFLTTSQVNILEEEG